MNREALASLLQRLDAVPSVSGFEENAGLLIEKEMSGCCDEYRTDPLGNRLFIKRGRDPSFIILLTADMDEPGFIVSGITPAGQVLLLPIGPPAPQPLQNQGYTLYTAQGSIPAVCAAAPADRQQAPQEQLLVLDTGARSRKGAENRGIAPGIWAVSDRRGQRIGKNIFTGRAADRRAGCAALITAMQLLKGVPLQVTVAACAAVQGRLGERGARAAAHALSPQLILRFTAAGDTAVSLHTPAHLGEGPAIRIYDGAAPGSILPPPLRRQLEDTARAHHIPWQPEVASRTREASMSVSPGFPVPAAEIGIPGRYRETPVCMVDMGDILGAARLAAAFLQQMNTL